jgi:hypothetical protein
MPTKQNDKFTQTIHAVANRANKISVKSAANPILWLCATSAPLCLLAAYWFRDYPWILYPLVYLAIFIVLCALYAIIYLLRTNPDKLQSEMFQLQQQQQYLKHLQVIQSPGMRTVIDTRSTPAIANPIEAELVAVEEAESK